MADLRRFSLFAAPSGLVLGSVHRLVAQISLVAGTTAIALALLLALQGAPLHACVPMLFQTAGFGFAHWRARLKKPDSLHLVLAFTWLTIACFDDGFMGSGITWVFYIPLSLGILLFLPRSPVQSAWLCSIPAGLTLVALGWTPRLNLLIPSEFAPVSRVSNFVAAILASILAIRYLLEQNGLALSKAQAASRAKSDFLSHISHEFRTPLNAISGFTDLLLLEASPDSDAVKDNLRAIRSSSEHLLHLINDVLDLSQMENGKLPLHPAPFSPRTVLEDLARTISPLAQAKGLALHLEIEGSLPGVQGDRIRWLQILLNLASNAVRYSQVGFVRLHARWEPSVSTLSVSVQDTGPGIPPEKLALIFEPYTRIEESNPTQAHGTGLGLAIARQLVDTMGGTLEVDSLLGQGSTFRYRQPFTTAELAVEPAQARDALAPSLAGRRILLCEDTAMNVRLATKVLEKLGAEYEVAEDGRQSLELLRKGNWDLVLLDLHMPYHDGYEVAERIRDPASDIPCKDVPILALTADASLETARRTRDAGMDDCLTKPFKLHDLALRASALIRT